MFFKHRYLTQPSVTPLDIVVQAPDDLCKVLKILPPVKGEMRTDAGLLVNLFKQMGGSD